MGELIGFIVSAGSSIVAGGATGILGSIISTFGALRKVKEHNRHAERMEELSIESMEVEAKLHLEQTVAEGEIKEGLAAYELMQASFEHDKATYFKSTGVKWIDALVGFLFGLIDFLRGAIRPLITLLMVYVTIELHNELLGMMGQMRASGIEPLAPDQVAAIYANMNNVIMYIATTVILWWFGTRLGASAMRWIQGTKG